MVRWVLAVVLLAAVAAGGLAAATRSGWRRGRVLRDETALARVRPAGLDARLVRLEARDADGRRVPVRLEGGAVVPRGRVAQGERVTVDAEFRRPSWLGWLLGRKQHARVVVTAPRARLAGRWLQVQAGKPVRVGWTAPVASVSIDGRRRTLGRPRAEVTVPGAAESGRVSVAAAPRAWERLSAPATVTWFPAGPRPRAIVEPAPGTTLKPWQPLRVTFSQPLGEVLGSGPPKLDAAGTWTKPDGHTLEFRPGAWGYPLGGKLRLPLPTEIDVGARTVRSLSWPVAAGSPLRLEQLLAQLDYLPLRWRATGIRAGDSPLAQLNAALDPPEGRFSWRYPHVPRRLKAMWKPARPNPIVRGAVVALEHRHGLAADGVAGPKVWRALLADAAAGKRADGGYSYVLVHRGVPQTLTLWHDGKQLLKTRVNTGVPGAPTELGTYPVWLRFRTQTMSGTNPDGSHYSDPGIRWISYFHGGEAIHGFDRGSYGYPQSVGCVELPVATAKRVWPYTPVGTLVTIAR